MMTDEEMYWYTEGYGQARQEVLKLKEEIGSLHELLREAHETGFEIGFDKACNILCIPSSQKKKSKVYQTLMEIMEVKDNE